MRLHVHASACRPASSPQTCVAERSRIQLQGKDLIPPFADAYCFHGYTGVVLNEVQILFCLARKVRQAPAAGDAVSEARESRIARGYRIQQARIRRQCVEPVSVELIVSASLKGIQPLQHPQPGQRQGRGSVDLHAIAERDEVEPANTSRTPRRRSELSGSIANVISVFSSCLLLPTHGGLLNGNVFVILYR